MSHLLSIGFALASAVPANYSGRVFDSKTGALVYLFHHDEHLDGKQLFSREVYSYPTLAAAVADGLSSREATLEESVTEDDSIVLYTFEQKQRKQKAVVEVDNGIIYYTWTDANGQKQDQSKAPAHVLTTSTAQAYVMSEWADVAAGKSLPAKLVIPWKYDTYGATFIRQGDEVTLKPDNPILALLAGRIFFRVSGPKIISYHGPVMAAHKVGEKWHTVYADVLYDR